MAASGWNATGPIKLGCTIPAWTPTACAIGCWAKADNVTAAGSDLAIFKASDTTHRIQLSVRGDLAGDPVRAAISAGGSVLTVDTSAGYSASIYQLHLYNMVGIADHHVTVAGGSEGTSVTSVAPATLDTVNIGLNHLGLTAFAGSLGYVFVYGAALSAASIALLAAGHNPWHVQYADLLYLWQILAGNRTLCLKGGVTLTETGTLTGQNGPSIVAAHPALYGYAA